MTKHKTRQGTVTLRTVYMDRTASGEWKETTRERQVAVGDVVGFKYDVEQSSPIKQMRYNDCGQLQFLVTVTEGEYPHGDLWTDAADCW